MKGGKVPQGVSPPPSAKAHGLPRLEADEPPADVVGQNFGNSSGVLATFAEFR